MNLLQKLTNLFKKKEDQELETMHFVSPTNTYIYLVIIGDHCKNEKDFMKIFPNASKISESKFDKLYNEGNGAQIITVADAHVIDEMFPNAEQQEKNTIRLN